MNYDDVELKFAYDKRYFTDIKALAASHSGNYVVNKSIFQIPTYKTKPFLKALDEMASAKSKPVTAIINGGEPKTLGRQPEQTMPSQTKAVKQNTYIEPSYTKDEPLKLDTDPKNILNSSTPGTFANSASTLVENGWSIYPQESDSTRAPGKVHGERIKWQEKFDLTNKRIDHMNLNSWKMQCANHNVACVMGPASGNLWAVDIDVKNPIMARDIADLAEEHFGETPFKRIGEAPKIALFYRYDSSDPIKTQNANFGATDKSGQSCGYALEIQGAGKSMTMFGQHHKTGQQITWVGGLGNNPLFLKPTAAPIVSNQQLEKFMSAVAEKYPFAVKTRHVSAEGDASKIRGTGQSLEDDYTKNSAGLINNGREDYLAKMAYRTAKANPTANFADLSAAVTKTFRERAELSGRWNDGFLRAEVNGKVARLVNAPNHTPPTPIAEATATWSDNRRLIGRQCRTPTAPTRTELLDRSGAEAAQAVCQPPSADGVARSRVHAAHSGACADAAHGRHQDAAAKLDSCRSTEQGFRSQSAALVSKPEELHIEGSELTP